MTTITKTKQPGGLHSYMMRWNELAEKAGTLGGIKGVKIHTSEFESYVIAERRVAWLEAQIASLGAAAKAEASKTSKRSRKQTKTTKTNAAINAKPRSPRKRRGKELAAVALAH
jgi:hypothetical protein